MKTISLFGIPEQIVYDNGSNFTSQLFKNFCRDHDIHHFQTSAHHQHLNGQVERMVRTFKSHMKKCMEQNNMDIDIALENFFFNYRNTPNSTTGIPPRKLMFNHDMRTKWDLLKYKKDDDNTSFTVLPKNKTMNIGEKIWYRNFGVNKWDEGVIIKKESNMLFQIQTKNGILRRHLDQLKKRFTTDEVLIHHSNTLPTITFYKERNVTEQEKDCTADITRPSRNRTLPARYQDYILNIKYSHTRRI
ncbi:uncharacterized protein LOC135924223 [Gordionus sp. m RMFG-2023]|uniref:uncharacterized protein LOC135924223 n=1 Tax=Gordionus sp. m RMFG-2023 TaxID=3053472 RepID=UPI0031FD5791